MAGALKWVLLFEKIKIHLQNAARQLKWVYSQCTSVGSTLRGEWADILECKVVPSCEW